MLSRHCGRASLLGDIAFRHNSLAYANLTQLENHFLHASPVNVKQSDGQTLSCPRCHRQYKLKKTLNRHIYHECGKDKTFKCSICYYTTFRNDRLLAHVRHVHPSVAPLPKSKHSRKKFPKIVNVVSIANPNFN